MSEQHIDIIAELPSGYKFHHIGYATTSLEKERSFFTTLGYHQEGESFSDLNQGVTGCFMSGPGPRIELLENLPDSTILTPWIKAGIKMYHFAYFVDSLDEAINWAREKRGKICVESVSAVAFGGRQICFVIFRNGLMLEFIENSNSTIS